MDRSDHPVWQVYDLLRKARLNVKYYRGRVEKLARGNFWMEVIIGITVPTSAITGIFLASTLGEWLWHWTAGVAAVLAVMKPFLGLPDKIKGCEGLVQGYRGVEYDMQRIRVLVQNSGLYGPDLQASFLEGLERMKALSQTNPEKRQAEKLRRKSEAQVRKELPGSSFFVPDSTTR